MKVAIMLICMLFAFISIPVKTIAQRKQTKADMAMTRVAEVPEVKAYLKKFQKEKAILLLQGEPTADRNFYWISLGISDADRFRPNSHFYVNPNTLQVFYHDIFISQGPEKNLTLPQWRRLRQTAGWNKMHYYKNGKLIVDEP